MILALVPACQRKDHGEPVAAVAREDAAAPETPDTPDTPEAITGAIDVHVHLTTGAEDELVAALDRHGIGQAVVMATPHLDPAIGGPGLANYQQANEVVLRAAAAHPEKLIPFVTVDLDDTDPAELESLLDRGACGVKIYQGHRSLRELPLDDARHHPLYALLARRGTPVLFHVNTVRFRDELARVLRAFPALDVVCAHFCGSRTDLDRLAGLLREFPRLLVDTSHGAGAHGAAGFANLERDRERLRAMIAAEPARFLFGSDLVTVGAPDLRQSEWDLQLAANLGLLAGERFRFWRRQAGGPAMTIQEYRGLALQEPVRGQVLAGNARRWLAPCLSR